MPKELKDFLRTRLEKRAEEIGIPGLVDMIADETVAETAEEVVEYLIKMGHPAMEMDPLF